MMTVLPRDVDGEAHLAGLARRRQLRRAAVGAGVLIVVMVAVLWWFVVRDGVSASPNNLAGPRATAEVTRQSIADTRTFSGPLGHGEATLISTTAQGVVTGLAAQGAAVDRGSEIIRVNEEPVIAFFGTVPMYRDLGVGDTGADVAQLEENLAALGYGGFTVDDTFTGATVAAVERWQRDVGLPVTGLVRRSDVIFVPEGGRIDTLHTRVGATVSPGSAVLDLTGSAHVVSLEVAVRDRDLLAVGTAVTVRLPGGAEVGGTVSAANAGPADGSMGSSSAADTVIRVEVTLDEHIDASLLGANADVLVQVDERIDVLTVPVNALLALAEGGHGVEVVDADGTTRLVPVQTGLFAAGRVEVVGEGIEDGTVVVRAGR